jgi:hypothetical protein
MLSFEQAVRSVRKSRPPSGRKPGPYGGGRGGYSADEDGGRAGNRRLSGDVLSVDDAAAFLERAAKEKLKADPSHDVIQYINQLARTQQWSPELGRAAAARAMEWARQFGGGNAPGFQGGNARSTRSPPRPRRCGRPTRP